MDVREWHLYLALEGTLSQAVYVATVVLTLRRLKMHCISEHGLNTGRHFSAQDH
jgi:hypothetical protein